MHMSPVWIIMVGHWLFAKQEHLMNDHLLLQADTMADPFAASTIAIATTVTLL